MKKLMVFFSVSVFVFTVQASSFAMDHDKMMMGMSNVAHEEVVEGVKASFMIISMKERMKEMKMEMPKGMKETHHLMIEFQDPRTGKALTEGEVKIKIQGPDKTEQVKNLMAMSGMAGMEAGFGADIDLSKKGKYGIMAKFKLKDGKTRSAKFWYEVK
ncbi:MAG: hypothetical protein A2X80_01145 [Geobacteraceae bacterium GWB2_52_12]|nr:MAG: hypothetical protein A2X80_01145 [Geobacteraceae bacterium GWB2_52_12]